MSWDYRVVETEDGYTMREVYYDDDGNIKFYSQSPVEPFGCDLPDLSWDISKMVEALGMPVLKEKELEEANSRYRKNIGGKFENT